MMPVFPNPTRGEATPPWTGGRASARSRRTALAFGVILVGLAAVALATRTRPGAAPRGLPEDAAVRAAIAALDGAPPVALGDLRLVTALDPDGPERAGTEIRGELSPGESARIGRAFERLEEARRRMPRDPRLVCALGHLDLAARRPERAERRYREALGAAPRYFEARLGLGVTLALRAAIEGDERAARRLTLRAIAQLAAVEEGDRCHLPALYNRALLLARVGRLDEARRWTRRYAELDPGSAWAASLARLVSAAGN